MAITGTGFGGITGTDYSLMYRQRLNQKVNGDSNQQRAQNMDFFSGKIKELQDKMEITAEELAENQGKKWWELSDEQWDKMMEGVDKYIEAFVENTKEMARLQQKAIQKVAAQASADMKSAAVSHAALAVAANGFAIAGATVEDAAEGATDLTELEGASEDGAPAEKKTDTNWTHNLRTEDQGVLRIAEGAQKVEENAKHRLDEMASRGLKSALPDDPTSAFYRRKR